MERFRSEDGTNCYSQLQLLAGRTLCSIDFRSRGKGGAAGDSGSSGRKAMPKSKSDLILWISNLAVNGALNYRWGKDYWEWKERDSGLLTQPVATAHDS